MPNLIQSLSNDDKLSLMQAADIITVDTEGVSTMVGFSICFDGLLDGFYLPFNHTKDNLTKAQKDKTYFILASSDALVFHNAMHDLRVLRRHDFNYQGRFYDTMLMAHWLNEERVSYKLDDISKAYGYSGKAMPESMSMVLDMDGWDAVSVQDMTDYSGNDAFITHQIFRKMLPKFQEEGFDGELWETEQEFIRHSVMPMVDRGIKIDPNFCYREIIRGRQIMEECKKELNINPGSPRQLEKLLIHDLGLPVVKYTPAGKPSFDKEAMGIYEMMLEKNQSDQRAYTILRYRGWMKTISANYESYLNNMDQTMIVHPNYMLHRARTARLACSDPALHQIPKSGDKEWNGKSKAAFVPRTGHSLWTVDYSQLQFRMAASYANCQSLLDIMNDPTRDVFTEMAKEMGWLRDDVKTLVYLIIFGGGVPRAKQAFNVDESQASELLSEFHATYPEIRRVSRQAQNTAQSLGYVKFWTGRRRHFPKGSKYYRAFNACIQGGEAEIMKRAMIALNRAVCNDECSIVLQIHDELAFEILNGFEKIYLPMAQKVMEREASRFCKFTGVPVLFPTSVARWGDK